MFTIREEGGRVPLPGVIFYWPPMDFDPKNPAPPPRILFRWSYLINFYRKNHDPPENLISSTKNEVYGVMVKYFGMQNGSILLEKKIKLWKFSADHLPPSGRLWATTYPPPRTESCPPPRTILCWTPLTPTSCLSAFIAWQVFKILSKFKFHVITLKKDKKITKKSI